MPSPKAVAIGLLVLVYGAMLLVMAAATAHDLMAWSRRRRLVQHRGSHATGRALETNNSARAAPDASEPVSRDPRVRSTRQFAVQCVIAAPPVPDVPSSAADQLRSELLAGGLEEVVVVPDAQGDRLSIRGLAPARSEEAARILVEDQIYDATLDLIILKPGVWVDERARR